MALRKRKILNYALEGYDPKDEIVVQKLECEKRTLQINKSLERMSGNNRDYSRLTEDKKCQEEKIIAYKNAENEMIAIQDRFGDNLLATNKDKMNYYFTEVVPNIIGKRCSFFNN